MFKEFTTKDFEEKNPAQVKEEQRLIKEKEQQEKEAWERKKLSKENTSIAAKVDKSEKERRLQTFDRFDQDFVTAYMEERSTQKAKLLAKDNKNALDQFVNVANVEEFNKPERVTKRLARMGICSRRMAEKLIE